MKAIERILVVVERSESASVLLEKAVTFAHAEHDPDVQIIQVMYEPAVELGHMPGVCAQDIKLELMRGEERKLVEVVQPFKERFRYLYIG